MTAPHTGSFLHLASGDSGAGAIRETVRRLGRDEVVIGMRDTYAVGPLGDVDEGAASRLEWWSRLEGKPLDPADAHALDDREIWAQVRAASSDVMLWHGPHPVERIFAVRACWHLRDQPDRVHEVALTESGRQWKGGIPRPAFYDAVAIVGPNETCPAWGRRAKVPDVAARARQWEELKARPGDWIRYLVGDNIVHRPVTACDAALVQACTTGEWTQSSFVVGRVLAYNPVSDKLLYWRVRELLRAGTLEGRGDENRVGLPREVRAS